MEIKNKKIILKVGLVSILIGFFGIIVVLAVQPQGTIKYTSNTFSISVTDNLTIDSGGTGGSLTVGTTLTVNGTSITASSAAVTASSFSGSGANLTGLNAAQITSGQIPSAARIPDLPASKITTGTFAAAQIPSLDAGKITTGTFAAAQIPSLDAGKITSGTFSADRIPSLDALKITTGIFDITQIPHFCTREDCSDSTCRQCSTPSSRFVMSITDSSGNAQNPEDNVGNSRFCCLFTE